MKINAMSPDFPMRSKYSNISTYFGKPDHASLKIFRQLKNGYNSESPDFFKLDNLQETQQLYRNPFLEHLVTEDRSAVLKNLNKTKSQINIIDKLKCNREWSQNPEILKKLTTSFDEEIFDKRNRNKQFPIVLPENFVKLEKAGDSVSYNKKLRQLHHEYTPKQFYGVKNTLSFSNSNTLDTYNAPLHLKINPLKSSYLGNYNDFKISESSKPSNDRIIKFSRKEKRSFNCILDKEYSIKPDAYIAKKWDTFPENYLMIMDYKKGLAKKSELFTEFVDRNQRYIATQKIVPNSPKVPAPSDYTEPSSSPVFKKSFKTMTKIKKTSSNYNNLQRSQTEKQKGSPLTSFKNIKNILEEKKLYKIQNHLIKTGAFPK